MIDPSRAGYRWRMAAIIVFVLGMISAGVDYWAVSRSPADEADLSSLADSKKEQYMLGKYYGQSGYLIEDLEDDVKSPGVQASLILVFSGLVAGVCWKISRLPPFPKFKDSFEPPEKRG